MENIVDQSVQPEIIKIKIKRKQKQSPTTEPQPTPPPIIEPQPTMSLAELYIASLSEKDLMAYQIAKNHLESTFSLEKSNGFIEWKKK